ncbi:M48 family metallopeptidase [Gallaecimonas kandeliae]|uniref:M48 family metallopeptidase n=1 Tax=Gallaecimonas kandeliae TaxID=3029055 RepID=UPI00264A1B1A|nr:M48 family metallopeptidase [Gallaecimonas kandeliae]WKE63910.1 M48 family metallopeptidase [Gallaecimonas kandeliae]
MDFFSHQDQARKKTTQLLVLFILGLLLLSLVTAALLGFGLRAEQQQGEAPLPLLSWSLYGWVTAGIGTAAFLAAFVKYMSLRGGGRKVAEALGGRRVSPHTQDPDERKLLNVVEEMAIAAGMPVPPVYLLDQEPGINAFAAGFTVNDAVIGVTRGAVEQFDRAELQAVIGHEFSHIFNGDMRLNLRLVALLFGLLFVGELGRLLLYSGGSGRNKKDGNSIALLGLGLVIMGYLGVLWARIMQAAINRQREYLADASSVQFTRLPDSLASALKKVGGHAQASVMLGDGVQNYSHLFFGPALTAQFAGLLASHPPLADRIRRLEPNWDGQYIRSTPNHGETVSPRVKRSAAPEALVQAGVALAALPQALIESSRDPLDACYLMFALLLDDNETVRERQLALLAKPQLALYHHRQLGQLQEGQRLLLVEKVLPSLKAMSDDQYRIFRDLLMKLAQADGKLDLFEWLLYRLVDHHLGRQYHKRVEPKVRFKKLSALEPEALLLLSALAWQSGSQEKAERAFGMGTNSMGLYSGQLLDNPEPSQLGAALNKLQEASEPVRQQFLRGALKAVQQDGEITPREAEFFRVLAVCLDCPIAL